MLKVTDATETGSLQPRGKQTFSPERGSIWYQPVSGIWQTVWAEAVDKWGHIADYQALAKIDGSLRVFSEIRGDGEAEVELLEDGKVIASAQASDGRASLNIENPHLWSPDDPYLYGLRIKLVKDGKTIDKVEGYTAFREISIVEDADGHKRMALNGKPLFHYGPLDQGWWPDGLYTAPCDEALKYDLERTKEFGFNMIRKHVKVEPDRWYYHCDKLGILVWQDMPSVDRCKGEDWGQGIDKYDAGNSDQLSMRARGNFIHEWQEIVNQHKKFPCIVVWVPFNEAWGQFDTRDVVDFTRRQDSTRLVNAASGGNHYENCGDILDCHHYPNPQQYLWSPTEANVVGEYGGIGLALPGHLWQEDRNWGYVQYKSKEEVTETYLRYSGQLLDLVGRGCSGAVYTQTSDVEIEVNGLMTYDRKEVKVDVLKIREANLKIINELK